MTNAPPPTPPWARRAAERSPSVQRSRDRSIQQATRIIDAAFDVIDAKGSAFTVKDVANGAHIALQTFYRHFASRDELMLALFEQTIADSVGRYRESARHLPDPLDRLRHYVTAALSSLEDDGLDRRRRFITAEHYRVHELHPQELGDADRHFTELLIPEIQAATDAGQLASSDAESDAWTVTMLVMASYHHRSFQPTAASAEDSSENIWRFCLRALGGR